MDSEIEFWQDKIDRGLITLDELVEGYKLRRELLDKKFVKLSEEIKRVDEVINFYVDIHPRPKRDGDS